MLHVYVYNNGQIFNYNFRDQKQKLNKKNLKIKYKNNLRDKNKI